MKLEDNADSALYPRRRKKVANAVILIAKMLKVSEYCSGSRLSESGFVVRSFLLYIALVSH